MPQDRLIHSQDWRRAEPAALATLIRSSLAAVPIHRVYAVHERRSRPDGVPTGVFRVTVVLAGSRRIEWSRQGRVHSQLLTAGEAIVVSPSGWSRPSPRQIGHRYCSIDVYPGLVRFMCESNGGLTDVDGSGAYYAEGPLPAAARGLLQALTALVEAEAEDRLTAVLRCYLDEVLLQCRPTALAPQGHDDWQRAAAWAHDHLDAGLGRDRLAAAIGVHPNHLSRLCRRCTGASLQAFLAALRLTRAQALLTDTNLSLDDIAAASGFGTTDHFRRRFLQHSGHSPSTWRRLRQADLR